MCVRACGLGFLHSVNFDARARGPNGLTPARGSSVAVGWQKMSVDHATGCTANIAREATHGTARVPFTLFGVQGRMDQKSALERSLPFGPETVKPEHTEAGSGTR